MLSVYDEYLSGQLDEGTFYLNSDIESFTMGRINCLHRDWIFVDILYILVHVCNDHWVAF